MNNLKPIETVYNGYRFRSRLEAKWAVFFDALGVEYEYEPEGFTLSNGDYYLPDFFLPKSKIYVEVKPVNAFSIAYHDDMVFFDETATKYGVFATDMTDLGYGVWFVFGDPMAALLRGGDNHLFCKCECAAKFYEVETCICDGERTNVSQCNKDLGIASGSVFMFMNDYPIWGAPKDYAAKTDNAIPAWIIDMDNQENKKTISEASTKTFDACKAARQARFEHGEMPIAHFNNGGEV